MPVYENIACWSTLPVPVDLVRDEVLATGLVSRITFYGVDVDPTVVAGISKMFTHKPPYATDEHLILQVIYSIRLPYDYQRLVACKEILHVLDSTEERAGDREAVEKLIDEIVVPIDIAMSLPTRSDRIGILNALKVLLPRDALSELRALHAKGEINEEDVAVLAQIPEAIARYALTDGWWKIVDID